MLSTISLIHLLIILSWLIAVTCWLLTIMYWLLALTSYYLLLTIAATFGWEWLLIRIEWLADFQ